MSFSAFNNLVFLLSIIFGVGKFHNNFLTLVDVLGSLVAAPVKKAEDEVQNLGRKIPQSGLGSMRGSTKGCLPPNVIFN